MTLCTLEYLSMGFRPTPSRDPLVLIIVPDLDLTLARASRPWILRRASFWCTATTVETVPTATHNSTLSPASRALERGRSVREYPMHVSDPMSSLGHAVWRFLLRRAAGRYAAHDLSDGIGANSCPCAFHWLWYLLGQPRFSESFFARSPTRLVMGASRAELQASFSWLHRVPDRHHHRGTLEASPSNFHLACGDRRAAASSRTTSSAA